MAFQLPDLPFAPDALAPHMSAETLEFHHGKHHRAYVNKTNELMQDEADLSGASLTQVIREARRAGNAKLFNNSAQLWNHSFFWQCLAPAQGQKPDLETIMVNDGAGEYPAHPIGVMAITKDNLCEYITKIAPPGWVKVSEVFPDNPNACQAN